MSARRTVHDFPPSIVYDVTRRFMDGESATEIKDAIRRSFPNDACARSFTREQTYPTLREAVTRGYLKFDPPLAHRYAELIGAFPNKGEVRVVDAANSEHTTNEVAVTAAKRVMELIKEIERERPGKPVHIGMGIGRTNQRLAMALGSSMRRSPDMPELVVHALNTDHATWETSENPISYFTHLKDAITDVRYVGLQASLFQKAGSYSTEPLYHQALERRDEIDIIISSIATREDEHGFLRRYMQEYSWVDEMANLDTTSWVGDMMLRPFDAKKPVKVKGRQPVALFDLVDLVEFARKPDKHVVLMCSACGHCGGSKLPALIPLLTEPDLHVWDNLILDLDTARGLVKQPIP